MRTALPLVLLALIAYSSFADETQTQSRTAWAQEPDSFRGVSWGASEESAKAILGKPQCGNIGDKHSGKRGCLKSFPLGDYMVKHNFHFKQDKLVYVYLTFEEKAYAFLRTVFVEKYGQPTNTQKQMLQNRMGAEFQDETLTWEGTTVYIMITRYASKVTEGMAIIGLKSEIQSLLNQDQKKAKEAADDL